VSDSSGNQAVVRSALIIHSPEAESITLSQQGLSLDGNGHYQLAATVEPRAWAGKLQWSSSDESVAVVSDGLISWVGTGSCVITAQAGDVTAECQVTCGYVSVSSIQLDYTSLTLEYDETESLTTTVIPSNWRGAVTWMSSDPTVATVEDGKVTWAGVGECTITATVDGRTATCDVICKEPEIESLTIEEEEINLSANGTYAIVPTILPEIWSGEITWTTSDPSVATVENGLIRWVSAGECTITATAGECTDSVAVHCAERGTLGDILDGILGGGHGDDEEKPDSQDNHED
ncbi:MAG: Ig-like domain-containing protein, partial [Candidatus Onthomonas sp.]